MLLFLSNSSISEYPPGALHFGPTHIDLVHSAHAFFHSVQLDTAKNYCRFGKLHMLEIDGDQLCFPNSGDAGAILNVFTDLCIRIDHSKSADEQLP